MNGARLLEVGGQRLSARFGDDRATDLPAEDHGTGRHRGVEVVGFDRSVRRAAVLDVGHARPCYHARRCSKRFVLPESRNRLAVPMTQPGGGATEQADVASGQGMRRKLGPIVVGIVAVLGLVVGGGLLVDALGSDAARPARVRGSERGVG